MVFLPEGQHVKRLVGEMNLAGLGDRTEASMTQLMEAEAEGGYGMWWAGRSARVGLTVTVTYDFGSKCTSFPLEPSLLHVLAPSEWYHFFPSDCP